MPIVELSDLKLALGVTTTTDDFEMQQKLDAAEAEYVERVGPLPGSYTTRTTLPWQAPKRTTSVAVTLNGEPVTVLFDSSENRRLVTWPYPGLWDLVFVTVTYVVGPVPLNHEEAILADVAEYWARTQQSSNAGRPGFEDPYAGPGGQAPRPVTLFPRIRALAAPFVF